MRCTWGWLCRLCWLAGWVEHCLVQNGLKGGCQLASFCRNMQISPSNPVIGLPNTPALLPPLSLANAGVGEAVDTELGRRLQARVTAEPDMFAEDDIFAATPTDVKEKEAAAAAAAQVGGARCCVTRAAEQQRVLGAPCRKPCSAAALTQLPLSLPCPARAGTWPQRGPSCGRPQGPAGQLRRCRGLLQLPGMWGHSWIWLDRAGLLL